jgi:hypothetical protein
MRTARTGVFLAAVVATLGFGACSGDDGSSEADVREEIVDQLVEDGALDEESAECYAGLIVDEVGAENLDDVDFSDEEPPVELHDEYASAAQKAFQECDIDPESLGG